MTPPTSHTPITDLERAELELLSARCRAAELASQQSERDLAAAQKLHHEILEALPGGVIQVDMEGAILYANAAARRILDMSFEEAITYSVRDFQHRTLYEDFSHCPIEDYPVTRCLLTGDPQPPAMIGVERADGNIVWGLYSAFPIRDPQTNWLQGAIVTFLDVTQRKVVELRLRESEERYRRLVQNAPDGIVVHHRGRIIYVNEAAVKLYGGTQAEQLIHRSIFEFIDPESHDRARERIRLCQEAGETLPQVEQTLIRLDGSRVTVEVTGTPCIYQENVCTQAILRDISVRKAAEDALYRTNVELERRVQTRTQELLRKNEELEQEIQERRRAEVELQDKQRFLERMLRLHERERQLIAYEIHDTFVQDLIAALMFCDSISQSTTSSSADDPALDKARTLLRRAIDTARRTISGLRPTIIDEQGIVAAIEFLISEYRERGMQIRFDYSGIIPRMPSMLEGNVFRIVQEALTNLARHSGTSTGLVTILREGDYIHLEVSDQGVGFDPHKVPEGKFGLQGMKERARVVAGRFRVESSPGAGTRVHLEMPIVPIDESGEG